MRVKAAARSAVRQGIQFIVQLVQERSLIGHVIDFQKVH